MGLGGTNINTDAKLDTIKSQQIDGTQKTLIGDDFAYRIDGIIRSTSKGLGSYNFADGDLLPLKMNYAGTGTVINPLNSCQITVGVGQFSVAQSRIRHEYIPGNPQLIEFTGDNLQPIAGTTVEFGTGTDSIISPFSGAYDGFSYSTDDTTSYFNVKKGGVTKLSVARADWDNPLIGYDFTNFTVFAIDYLYLGGAGARFFVKVGNKFVLVHSFDYAGTDIGTFINNPNLPTRIAVRSTTGTRTTNVFCVRVATEGETNDGISISRTITMTSAGYTAPTVGVSYAMLGIRLKSTNLHSIVKIVNANPFLNSNDQVRFNFCLNPTVAGVVTFTDVANAPIQQMIGVATNVVTGGTFLPSVFSGQESNVQISENNLLDQLGVGIDGSRDTIYLVATLLSPSASLNGTINFKF